MSKARNTLGTLISVLLLLVIFCAVNLLAARHHGRIDLTEDSRYTLPDGLVDLLGQLAEQDDIVEIAVYMTEKVPGHAVAARNQIQDLVRDIETAARGSVVVTIIDPEGSEQLADEAAEYGILPIQMIAPAGSGTTIARVYAGIVIKRGGDYETVAQLLASGRSGVIAHPEAEYQITAALLKVTRDQKKTVGFLAGHGELSMGDPANPMQAEIRKVYDTTNVDTAATGVVPENVDLLVVRAPSNFGAVPPAELDDRDVYAIDQFIMTGKPVIFLMPRAAINDQGQLGMTLSGLDDLIIHSGVEISTEVVVDVMRLGGMLEMMDPQTRKRLYTAICSVGADVMDAEHPITSRLGGMQAVLANPVRPSTNLGERTLTPLVSLPAGASTVSGLQDLDLGQNARVLPGVDVRPASGEAFLYCLVEGPLESMFKSREIPGPREPAQGAAAVPPEAPFLEKTERATLVFSGLDPLFRAAGGFDLLLNTIDYLILGEELISVRSRTVETRPLELMSDEAEEAIEAEIVERYVQLDAEFKLEPTLQEFQGYTEDQVKRLRGAVLEIADAKSDAVKATRWFYYGLNLGLVPVLLVIGGILRFFWRRARSRRIFKPAG